MGIEKIGTSIGKEIIAWTRTGKSLLTAKPIKINTCGLKYVPALEKDTVQIVQSSSNELRTVLNTVTHKPESISFSKLPEEIRNQYDVFDIYAYNSKGEDIGHASFKILKGHINPVTGKGRKDSLYIKYFGTAGGYKGIGSEIIRKLVQLSNKLGMEGRIMLEAQTGSVPLDFQYTGFVEKCNISAAIKYKKMGFNATNISNDKYILEEILNGGNGYRKAKCASGEYDRDIFGAIPMTLSDEAINKYLI